MAIVYNLYGTDTNDDVELVFPAVAHGVPTLERFILTGSYSAGDPAGSLTLELGSAVLFSATLEAGTFWFEVPIITVGAEDITVTLAAGGSSVVGEIAASRTFGRLDA